MKSKIAYSKFSTILTIAVMLLLFVGCIVTVHDEAKFFVILAIYLVMIFCALFYGPAYIKVTPDDVIMGSIFRSRKLPMRNIESVELFQPTMGAIRIFASGGFMGYWGIFKEGDIGRYYAFYGKSSDCLLIRMKNGDKYVLGCENPNGIVDYIQFQIKKQVAN